VRRSSSGVGVGFFFARSVADFIRAHPTGTFTSQGASCSTDGIHRERPEDQFVSSIIDEHAVRPPSMANLRRNRDLATL